MTTSWTHEAIAALVDGTIENAAEREALQRAIEHDPEAAAYAEKVARSNALLREAFAVPEDSAVPPGIEAALRARPAGTVTPLVARRRPTWAPVALAASVTLAVGLAAGLYLTGSESSLTALGGVPADDPLHAVLEHASSGDRTTTHVTPMLTFRDGAGRPCREFESGTEKGPLQVGVACRGEDGRWQVVVAVGVPGAEKRPEGYETAGGSDTQTLDATLDALGAGPALSPEEEAALIANGWRR